MAYVYGHYKADTGELFYIGKGTDKRAWSKYNRNPHWKNIVQKHGFTVKILHDNLTDDEAFVQEKILIEQVGQGNLCNMTPGGEGFWSGAFKEHPEWEARRLEALTKVLSSDEHRTRLTELNRKKRQDSEHVKRHLVAMRKRSQNVEWRQTQTEFNKKIARNPDRRRKISESKKEYWRRWRLKHKPEQSPKEL
jgi:PHP family Zn ribbon phosphoesterase